MYNSSGTIECKLWNQCQIFEDLDGPNQSIPEVDQSLKGCVITAQNVNMRTLNAQYPVHFSI